MIAVGAHATIIRGRREDQTGKVCRICTYTGMLWLHLDKYLGHDYAGVEFGPFFSGELSLTPHADLVRRPSIPDHSNPEQQCLTL